MLENCIPLLCWDMFFSSTISISSFNQPDLENHLHYMHFNPVKQGYVKEAREWRNSSYIEWAERGLYSPSFKWDEPKGMVWGEQVTFST